MHLHWTYASGAFVGRLSDGKAFVVIRPTTVGQRPVARILFFDGTSEFCKDHITAMELAECCADDLSEMGVLDEGGR